MNTVNLGLPLVEDENTLFQTWRKGINGNNTADSLSMAQIIDNFAGTVLKKPTAETFTISSWSALSLKAPFTKSAEVTATTTINEDTTVELINDNAVAFGTYGFAIGEVDGQTITIYAITEPTEDIVLKIEIGG